VLSDVVNAKRTAGYFEFIRRAQRSAIGDGFDCRWGRINRTGHDA